MNGILIAYQGSGGSVTIPSSVTSIGDGSFKWCTNLTSVRIPTSVTSIGESAFYGCTGLTSVSIPSSVTSIKPHTFYSCTGLTSVTIPSGITNIEIGAFYYCTSLTSVSIPSSVTNIEYAFNGCTSLRDIYYSGSESDWAKIHISGASSLNADLLNATIHYNSTGMGSAGEGPTPSDPSKEYKVYCNGNRIRVKSAF